MTEKIMTIRQMVEEATQQGRPVTNEYIRQQIKFGVLKAEKPGRDWLIPADAAKEWLERWLSKPD